MYNKLFISKPTITSVWWEREPSALRKVVRLKVQDYKRTGQIRRQSDVIVSVICKAEFAAF